MLNLYNLKHKNSDSDDPEMNKKGDSEVINKNLSADSYVDPDQELSGKKLKWGIWFATNQLFLYKILKISLLIFIFLTWGFSLYRWGIYLWQIPDQQKVDQQSAQSINYNNLNINYTAFPLQILGSQLFKSGVDKYDVISDVTNPNDDFIVYFDYYFNIFTSGTVKKQSTFLLPKQNRPIVHLGVDSDLVSSAPSLVIENLRWKRVSPHEITDVLAWQKYRLDFIMSNFSFSPAYSGDKTKPDVNSIKFTLTNDSPFSYYYPEFVLSLYQGDSFVGVVPFRINGIFSTLSSSTLDLRSFANGLSADAAVVYPLINIYDKSVYYDPIKTTNY